MEILNENDKGRIIAAYLNIADPNTVVDWAGASEDFGSASVESFKKMMQTAFKKLKEHDGGAGGSKQTPRKRKAAGDADDETTKTPAKTPTKKTPKTPAKKIMKSPVPDEDGPDMEDAPSSAAAMAKKGRGKAIKKEPIIDEDSDAADEAAEGANVEEGENNESADAGEDEAAA